MHKTVSASIGSTLFAVEESAYAALDAYLDSIRAHFAASPDADEIVADIENRIAEEFAEALGSKRKVILRKDVDAVIARMGTVEDFRDFDGAAPSGAPTDRSAARPVRLYRDADDQVLGGVCAGIAKYFSIDPIVVRLAFALSVFIGGFGVVLYILLWILLPEAKTAAEKVEMTGGRVTLSAIQRRIEEVVPPEKRQGIVGRAARFPFVVIGAVLRGIGRFLRAVLPIAARIVGLGILVGAAIAMAVGTFVFFAILINPGSPYIGFPLLQTVGWSSYVALLSAGYFAVLLPLLLALLVGISLVLLRNAVTPLVGGGIFAAWLVAIVAGGVTLFGIAPTLEAAIREFERATVVTHDDIADFDRVRADGIDRMEIARGDRFSIEVHGTEKAVALLEPAVEEGTLVLRGKPDEDRCIILCESRHARLVVTMPSLSAAEARDASRITLDGFGGDALELTATGVGRIRGTVAYGTLTLEAIDASRMDLEGTATSVTATASDVARIEAGNVTAQDVTATAEDASRITVDPRVSLRGKASDVSRIEYRTVPPTLEVETEDAARADIEHGDDSYEDRRF